MRLTTWNVNGIRNPFAYPPWNTTARTFPAMFDVLGSDIVVMQELKIQRKDLRDDMVLLDGWDCYFSLPKHKKGYSGVGIYTRNATCAPIRAEEGLLGVLPSALGGPYRDLKEEDSIGGYPTDEQIEELGVDATLLDSEGRCVIVEFPAFVLLGVYSPANSNGLRDDFRYGFICALDCRIRNLTRAGKRVVLVGDLNVSRDEQDGASAAEDMRKAGITHEDYISTPNRRIFNQLLIGGEVYGDRDEGRESGVLWDTTRAFHPERKGMYTHWEQKINARPGNYGSRIDFVLVARAMQSWIKDANIQEGLLGSDHCPVFVDFHDEISADGTDATTLPLLDLMSPEGTFVNGERKIEWKVPQVPAFSAKKMPEFDKRRSIKAMFTAPKPKGPTLSRLESSENTGLDKSSAEADSFTMIPQSQSSEHKSIAATASQTSMPSPIKRKSSASMAEPSSKRTKSEQQTATLKGQKSMMNFFKPKTAPANGNPGLTKINDAADESQDSLPSGYDGAQTTSGTVLNTPDGSPDPPSPPIDLQAELESVGRTQKSWSNLFAKPAAPKCESHDEPCKTMLTKKKGSNQGRSFWMCARPLGPSGNKERGTQWRCPTFIWCSDWSPAKPKAAEGKDGVG